MTLEDIQMVQESFAAAARRAREAGFDAVEIIASAGYLICQFLSPLTNLRTDQYGGSWENRCRFGVEVVRKVRERVGPDFPIIVRLSGNDFVPGSNTNREAALFARELEKAGVDCFNVTGGWHESRVPQITGELPRGGFSYLAYGIKSAVSVPVIASNRINDARVAEEILRSGQADLVNLGRQLLADPEFPNKVKEGRQAAIRRCIACNQGCMDMVFSLQEVFCAINPMAGREHEIEIKPAASPRKVLVIGGGPAGMEAARAAASRGHRVTLWEKDSRLGGQLHYATVPPGKREFINLVDYYTHSLAEEGVEVVLGQEATAEKVAAFNPDVVVLATGSRPAPAPFPIQPGLQVITAREALAGAPTGSRIVVIGGGAVGCETAVALAETGTLKAEVVKFLIENEAESFETIRELVNRGTKEVTLVEMEAKIGRDIGISTRWVIMKHLQRLGVNVMTQARVLQVDAQGVHVEKEGNTMVLPADTVVLAVGAVPVRDLAEELGGKVPELHIIGDAHSPRKFTEAIREGFDLVRQL